MGSCSSSTTTNVVNDHKKITKVSIDHDDREHFKKALEKEADFITRCNVRHRLDKFFDALSERQYNDDEIIFKYGEKSDILYLVASGLLQVTSYDGKDIGTLSRGDLIDHLDFFLNKPRSTTVKVSSRHARLYYIDLKTYNDIMFNKIEEPNDLKHFDIFYEVTDDVRIKLYEQMNAYFYNAGDVIVKEGDPFNCIHVVTNGSISEKIKHEVQIFVENNYFGHLELRNGSKKYLATYVANEASTVIKIPIHVLKSLMPKVYDSLKEGIGAVSTSNINVKIHRKSAGDKRKQAMHHHSI